MRPERSRRALVGAGAVIAALALVACASDRGGGSDAAAPVQGRPDHGEWRKLPPAPGARAAGLSDLAAVRVGDRVVVVAGGSYRRGGRVEALVHRLRPSDGVGAAARGGWSWAPRAPLRAPRAGASLVAGGGEAIVWGGATNALPGLDGRGARYDPLRGHWRPVANAPIAPRAFHSAVWTGSRMIVWGGAGAPYVPGRRRPLLADGAAYDPSRDRWSRVPLGPLTARSGHVAVWTGSRMIVWGGEVDGRDRSARRVARDGASYDPARRAWRRIADAPLRWAPGAHAFWTGERMVVWNGARAAAYSPAADRWEPSRWVRWPDPPPGIRRPGAVATWTGAELLVWGGPPAGCRSGECIPRDDRGRPVEPLDGAALDPRTGRWRPLPAAPLAPRDRHAIVGLGDGRAFVWGGCCNGSRQLADGAIYRPGPLVPADVGRDLAATCRALDAPDTAVRCPAWLPAPARRDGTAAFHVPDRDSDGSSCGYLTELHLRTAPPGAPTSAGRHPFHVWFGGRCRPLPLGVRDGRWPPRPNRTGYLGLVGVAPSAPGRSRQRLVRPRVVAVTSVRGRRALVLAVEPFPRGGLHGGHYAIVWNEGGDGYAISFHHPGGDRGLDPTPRQIRALTRAAESMRDLTLAAEGS